MFWLAASVSIGFFYFQTQCHNSVSEGVTEHRITLQADGLS